MFLFHRRWWSPPIPRSCRRKNSVSVCTCLLDSVWTPRWRKAVNTKPRPKVAKAKQSGAHTSMHRLLHAARQERIARRLTACLSQRCSQQWAWGPIEKGYRQLTETFRWVGGRFKGGPLVPENTVVFSSGDLAYTVGFERGEVVVDGGAKHPMTIRVTHVYRRFGDEWRLVHRHADFPPEDQRSMADAA